MDETSKKILQTVGIHFEKEEDINGLIIPRDELLDPEKYKKIQQSEDIEKLKKTFSSSALTCLQKDASTDQKWPLLNLVRQILTSYGFIMDPIRKCNGYTKEGVKLYKRFFLIKKKTILV
jgi:hypothetical protein